ncbi:ATP-dependent DNA helicase RecQ [Acidisarcina polymorpha]|uniref:ATP-dependent DNA helicase RecQ n=1 Tax=Acidisarcina polymorpha TaxID=2211140 RepID=A0A2Z5G7R6_9BACT|nr:ATP-dependent DNA helicase RecQ [Acidisarcina polymorpha]AXC14616.1 ATP-dependent DNA helicase RecQ [Acidisarcina polymorpha]
MATKKKVARHHAIQVRAVPWSGLHAEAKERFGIKHFRPGQREVLEAVFAGRNALALMPTGSGKSLCYQLPALFLPRPVVVVSPLIALMRDQQEKAEDAHIAVEKLDSTLNTSEATEVQESIQAGIPQLLYVTPERLEKPDFLEMLAASGVSLMAVDEAHCISQWGHDFRPAYLSLRDARKALGDPPVLALTATASEAVVADILTQLDAQDAVVVNTGVERENLLLSVHHTVNTVAKQKRLTEMIAKEQGSGIIYTASVRSAVEIYEWLKASGVSVGRYHGRLKVKDREKMQTKFMHGDYKVLIATKAFGMGIDKPDIRFVYHYEFPDSLETYYQEAGRAGRDGKPARAVLLYRLEDKRIQRFFLLGRYPRLDEVRRLYAELSTPASVAELAARSSLSRRRTQVILHMLREAGLIIRGTRGYARGGNRATLDQGRESLGEESGALPKQEIDAQLEQLVVAYESRSQTDLGRLAEMMHYAESPQCRKQLLRKYFGEDEGKPCGNCDNCIALATRGASPKHADRPDQVTRIETIHGTILTTAPETLPSTTPVGLAKGDRIRHRRFGNGEVLDLDGQNIVARFDKSGTRKVRFTFIQRST